MSSPIKILVTGKSHISFSEVSNWVNCSWSHKLRQIDKIDLEVAGWGSSFGTSVHSACEHFIRTHVMDINIAIDGIRAAFTEHQFKDREGQLLDVEIFIEQARKILSSLPKWMEETFPGWEFIDAEHELYEPIEGHEGLSFKGFIDCIISCNHKGKKIIWLIDFKTSSWGWDREKRTDELTKQQLILYKNYWSKKAGVDPKKIRCGFVILKRTAREDSNCELIQVSVGDKTSSRALDVINNMFVSIERKMFLKNKTSCKYCPYKMTKHCEGTNCV